MMFCVEILKLYMCVALSSAFEVHDVANEAHKMSHLLMVLMAGIHIYNGMILCDLISKKPQHSINTFFVNFLNEK